MLTFKLYVKQISNNLQECSNMLTLPRMTFSKVGSTGLRFVLVLRPALTIAYVLVMQG